MYVLRSCKGNGEVWIVDMHRCFTVSLADMRRARLRSFLRSPVTDMGDDIPEMGDDIPEMGDDIPETGDDIPETGDDVPDMGDYPSMGESGPSIEDDPATGDHHNNSTSSHQLISLSPSSQAYIKPIEVDMQG